METFWLHRFSLNIKPRASLTITQQRNSSLEFRLPGSKKKTYNIQKANCSIWFLLSILARKSGQAQKKRSTMNLDVFVISLFLLLFMMFHDFFFRLRQMLVYLHQHNQVVEGKRRVLFYFKRQQGIWTRGFKVLTKNLISSMFPYRRIFKFRYQLDSLEK